MLGAPQPSSQPMIIGRYAIYDAIASGGMATVHLGRLVGPAGFSRTVAVKRLHPALAADPEVSQMLLDEARLVARIQHPNVVPTLDMVVAAQQMLLVMEYVRGDSLSRLVKALQNQNLRFPPNVAVAIMLHTLAGLHAAHEAVDEKGQPMGLVHRDVSPQNIMVGVDGVARVLDFGIAKAEGRLATTREGEVKGKVMYMAREQLAGEHVTRAADIYAAGIILFETLTGIRMFAGENEVAAVSRIVAGDIRRPSQIDPALAPFDMIVLRAAAQNAQERYATARDMANDLERICVPASAMLVGDWVQRLANERLDMRAKMVAEIERSTTRSRAAFAEAGTAPSLQADAPTSGVVSTRAPMESLPSLMTGPRPPIPMPVLRPANEESSSGFGIVAILVLVISLLLAGVGIAAILISRHAKQPPPSPAAVVVAPPPVATVEAPSTPDPEPITEPDPAPAASASAAAPARVAKPKTRPRCDPPYTIDTKGHKHFIPECVQ